MRELSAQTPSAAELCQQRGDELAVIRRKAVMRAAMMGADSLVFMLMMHLEFCIPARYWVEPEMPMFMMTSALTVQPLWPICSSCGSQPQSTRGREQASTPLSCPQSGA